MNADIGQFVPALVTPLEAAMNPKQDDPVIDEVREVRHRISEKLGHEPEKIVAHYMKLQEQYRDRLIGKSGSTIAPVPATPSNPVPVD